MLKKNYGLLEEISQKLLEKETMEGKEFNEIIEKSKTTVKKEKAPAKTRARKTAKQ